MLEASLYDRDMGGFETISHRRLATLAVCGEQGAFSYLYLLLLLAEEPPVEFFGEQDNDLHMHRRVYPCIVVHCPPEARYCSRDEWGTRWGGSARLLDHRLLFVFKRHMQTPSIVPYSHGSRDVTIYSRLPRTRCYFCAETQAAATERWAGGVPRQPNKV